MARYHVNRKGDTGLCRAKGDRCPFGDEIAHYETQDLAREAYEGHAQTLRAAVDTTAHAMFTMEAGLAKVSAQQQAVLKRILEGRSEDREQDLNKLEGLEDAYQRGIAAVRRAFYAREMAWEAAEADGLVDPEDRKSNHTQESVACNRHNLKSMRKVVTFTELKDNYKASAVEELAAWTGLTHSEAEAKIDAYATYAAEARDRGEEPLSEDAYVVSLFQDGTDTERLVASVDIETTGFHPTTSEIVEIGIVVRNRRGEVVEIIDERFDLENPEVRESLGVGPTNIHKITPEAVAGKPAFTDSAVQERLGRVLNNRNVVLLSHNKGFENSFLDSYLKGFRQLHRRHSAENLRSGVDPAPQHDTRALSAFLLHSTPDNRLESFSKSNGVSYIDAHSALPDAEMTLDALQNFMKTMQATPKGERPILSVEA